MDDRTIIIAAGTLVALVVSGAALYALTHDPEVPESAPESASGEEAQTAPAERTAQGAAEDAAAGPPLFGQLRSLNGSGRSGSYFLPGGQGRNVPLMVAFHGSTESGDAMVKVFRQLAERRGFAIVAPDSDYIEAAGGFSWHSPGKPDAKSPDLPHVERIIQELLLLANGRIARDGWLAVGFSGGGSAAAFLATHDGRYGAFADLHDGARPEAFGSYKPRGWFSTGEKDPMRSPQQLNETVQRAGRVLGTEVTQRAFPGAHAIGADEARAVVDFWLGPG